MSKIFFTSDLHLWHDREFLYGPRGFASAEENANAIVSNWNEVVSEEDTVYVLGDLILNDNEKGLEALKQLKGSIKIVLGNHDTDTRVKLYETLPNVEILGVAARFKYKKQNFYLSHYPTITSNLEKSAHLREHVLNLYGHTHQKSKFYQDIPFMYCVCADAHNCYPVEIEDILQDIRDEVNNCLAQL